LTICPNTIFVDCLTLELKALRYVKKSVPEMVLFRIITPYTPLLSVVSEKRAAYIF